MSPLPLPSDYHVYYSNARLANLVEAASDRIGDEELEDLEIDIQYEPGEGPPSARTRFKRVIVPLQAAPATAGHRLGPLAAAALQGQTPNGNASDIPRNNEASTPCSVSLTPAPLHPPPGADAPTATLTPHKGKKSTRRKQSIAHAKQRRGVRSGADGPSNTAALAAVNTASYISSPSSTLSLWPENGYVNAAKRKRTNTVPSMHARKKARIDMESVMPAQPATGQPERLRARNVDTDVQADPGPAAVQSLKDAGYQILATDPSAAGVVLDADGVICAVRARRPQGEGWDGVVSGLDAALSRLHAALGDDQAKIGKGVNRWDGVFKHIFWGVSFGGGQREPGYLAVKNKYHIALQEFTEDPAVRAFAKHIRSTMDVWQPEVLKECDQLVEALAHWRPDILPAYAGLPLFAESANTGDQAVAPDHYDMFNAIDKFCFVIPTGTYDPKLHGLIVLHELKVAIEAAPGDVVFFPSALICHGNTPIAPTAIRRSWTLFTAGALYRWWDAGFKTLRSMSLSERVQFRQRAKEKLRERMGRHMTLEQLKAYRNQPNYDGTAP